MAKWTRNIVSFDVMNNPGRLVQKSIIYTSGNYSLWEIPLMIVDLCDFWSCIWNPRNKGYSWDIRPDKKSRDFQRFWLTKKYRIFQTSSRIRNPVSFKDSDWSWNPISFRHPTGQEIPYLSDIQPDKKSRIFQSSSRTRNPVSFRDSGWPRMQYLAETG